VRGHILLFVFSNCLFFKYTVSDTACASTHTLGTKFSTVPYHSNHERQSSPTTREQGNWHTVTMPGYHTRMHGRVTLGSGNFSELSLRNASYILLHSDWSKMRLLPEAVFSEIGCYIGNPASN
jgi:hypothetical protein